MKFQGYVNETFVRKKVLGESFVHKLELPTISIFIKLMFYWITVAFRFSEDAVF